MSIVFTSASLLACLYQTLDEKWFESPSAVPKDGSWNVVSYSNDDTVYIIHRTDITESQRIIIVSDNNNPFAGSASKSWRYMIERVQRAALAASRPPLRLPADWSEYHFGNLVAFFAGQRRDSGNRRWIMESNVSGTSDVVFWRLTTSDNKELLQDFKADTRRYAQITKGWAAAFEAAEKQFRELPLPSSVAQVDSTIDLEATTFGSVTQYSRYSEWLERLTEEQRRFLQQDGLHAVKLRGPAGSGKTLALQLKLLRELYLSRDKSIATRIIYITHSWSMAEQVDESLRRLDEQGDLSSVDILPLLSVPQLLDPKDQSSNGMRLLGEDNLEGKRLQLDRISLLLKTLRQSVWLTFRSRVSSQFKARVESEIDGPEWHSLLWDLMNEFSCVLSAHNIMPGMAAERRYLAMQRTSWMMPLTEAADKLFVLRIYTEYVEKLKSEETLTSDQKINDFINYLETFAWNIRRESVGYDVIFVDELHLFSEQERLVFHYLAKSSQQYPAIYMSLDPRQSPNELYAIASVGTTASADSGEAELTLGPQVSLDLSIIHRFSNEILAFVRHIHHRYPALDLGQGEDWKLDLSGASTNLMHGKPPVLCRYMSQADEVQGSVKRAEALLRAQTSSTVAVLVIDPLRLESFVEVALTLSSNVCKISSRDEVAQLAYRKRSLVISAAEFVGGMQFDIVIIAALFDVRSGQYQSGYQLRRILSLLYLAVSRARSIVELHVCDTDSGLPEVILSAVNNGIIMEAPRIG